MRRVLLKDTAKKVGIAAANGSNVYDNSFIGAQLLLWKDEGVVIQMGEEDVQHLTGITIICHCIIVDKPGSNMPGFKLVNVEKKTPCMAAFGNLFNQKKNNENEPLIIGNWCLASPS